MRLALTLAIAVALLLPSAAGAATVEPSTGYPRTDPLDDTRTRDSLTAAVAFWGRTAPCGKVHVYAAGDLVETKNAFAMAEEPACTIWVDWPRLYGKGASDSPWEQRMKYCTVIAHEYGHLLGYEHSARSRSVMNVTSVRLPTRPCARRFNREYFDVAFPNEFALRAS